MVKIRKSFDEKVCAIVKAVTCMSTKQVRYSEKELAAHFAKEVLG